MKTPFLFVFCLISVMGTSQNRDGAGNKGQLHFDVGMEYRVTPIYSASISQLAEKDFFVSRDAQNSGPALNLGVEYYVFKNLSVGFVNSFRYDMIVSEPPSIPENEELTVKKSKYGLLFDYHLKLAYYLNISDRERLFVILGYSFMNRNSDFMFIEKLYDQNGAEVGYGQSIDNFDFNSNRFFLGYSKDRLKLQLGAYLSTGAPYFKEGNPMFIVPTIGIMYNAFRF